MKKILLGIGLALLLIQCDKEDEKDDTSTTDKASNVADCAPAVTAFTSNIQPAIASCVVTNCHVNPGGDEDTDLYFVANDAKKNRATLAGHDGGFWKTGDNLYKKITASHTFPSSKTGPGHTGGPQSTPDSGQVTKWTTAEAGCN